MKSLETRIMRLEERVPEESSDAFIKTLSADERDVLIQLLKQSIAEHERGAAAGLSPQEYDARQPPCTAAEAMACAKEVVALIRQELALAGSVTSC